ncbi:hypothetical protein C2G38_2248933 [Gigaspora rosea]|uniref:Uncharacterized protein n=1 Tax=Gigaspora rosea TaxID=44941 RepID=A0A397UX18_9GLOM|nr:hypothetical protein C2G38_2248933 [Gigaspora rosea]
MYVRVGAISKISRGTFLIRPQELKACIRAKSHDYVPTVAEVNLQEEQIRTIISTIETYRNEKDVEKYDEVDKIDADEKTLSFYDVEGSQSGKNAENVYHTFCLGMFVVARDRGYIVHSNHEDGMGKFGNYDVKIVPKSGVEAISSRSPRRSQKASGNRNYV